jgi:hypothetical protein
MKSKMIGAVGLVGAFVAGMMATAFVGGMVTVGANTRGTVVQAQQVTVDRIITPTITDEDIALLRQDLRAKKMQVIGENMSLSDAEAEKFWPIYNHYAKDLQEVNNQKYALLKQYAEMWATMTDQDAVIYVLAGGGRAGAGDALEVCAGGEPGVARKEGGDLFPVGPATEHDHRSAIVFADSIGACEGVGIVPITVLRIYFK